MRNTLYTILFASMLAACGEADPQHAIPAEVAAAPAMIIDDTPVEALQLGGAVLIHEATSSLADPENSNWREAQEYRLDLNVAPPVHPSVNLRYDAAAAPRPVFLRAAGDGENLYLRMRWPDTSEDGTSGRTEFADAAAVQFALNAGTNTSFMMGAPNGPVNIWYWKASEKAAQNLAAGGFGSTTLLESAGLESRSVYRDSGEWVVVFSRPLQTGGDHQVNLVDGPASMALALWQGKDKQRDGLKHVTMGWVSLQSGAETTASVEARVEAKVEGSES